MRLRTKVDFPELVDPHSMAVNGQRKRKSIGGGNSVVADIIYVYLDVPARQKKLLLHQD